MKHIIAATALAAILMFALNGWSETKPVKKAAPPEAVSAENSDVNAEAPPAQPEATGPQTAEDFQKEGDKLLKKKKINAAMTAYKKCLELAGDDSAFSLVALVVGKNCHAKKEYDDAVKYLSKVKGKSATRLSYKLMLAGSLQKTGNNDSAIALLEPYGAGTKLSAKFRIQIYKILGDAYAEKNQIEDAAKWLNKYIQVGGRRTADIVYLIASSYETKKPQTAIAIYRKNIKRFPKDFRNYLHLGKLTANSNATRKQAISLVKKAVTLADTSPATWLTIGRVFGRLGLKDNELVAYRTCLQHDENNLEAKIRIGSILLEQGSDAEAIEYLQKAHLQAPDSLGPMFALANAYQRTGKKRQAVEMLLKLKKAQPKNIEVRKQIAFIFMRAGKEQRALVEIEAALKIERDYEMLVPYAQLLLKTGRAEEAVAPLEEILGMVPDNVEALMTMAKVYRAQKKYAEAIEVYKEINIIDPTNARALYERAEIHLDEEKVKWAEMFYKRAQKADPNFALSEVGFAKIAKLYKNKQAFNEHLVKAETMAPNDPEVKEAIARARNPQKAAVAKPSATRKSTTGTSSDEEPQKEKKRRRKR